MRSHKKIIHGAHITISTGIRNIHIFLYNILQILKFADLLIHGHYSRIRETRNVMKYFSAYSGIHGFAPIWHIFLKMCAIWVQNHVCQNVQKNDS